MTNRLANTDKHTARREARTTLMNKRRTKVTDTPRPVVSRPAACPRVPNELVFDPSVNPSRTKQSEAEACDINNIMARYQRTGVIDHVSKWGPQYGDVPSVEFKEAMDIIKFGEAMYAELPSAVRDRFNDPAEFLAWVQDPANAEALEKAGLTGAVPQPSPEPISAPAASPGDSEAS